MIGCLLYVLGDFLFADSFRKQLTVIFGYSVDTAKDITKKAKKEKRKLPCLKQDMCQEKILDTYPAVLYDKQVVMRHAKAAGRTEVSEWSRS